MLGKVDISFILLLAGMFRFQSGDCLPEFRSSRVEKRLVFDILPSVRTDQTTPSTDNSKDYETKSKYKSKTNLMRRMVRKLLNGKEKNKTNYQLKKTMNIIVFKIKALNDQNLLTSI